MAIDNGTGFEFNIKKGNDVIKFIQLLASKKILDDKSARIAVDEIKKIIPKDELKRGLVL